MKNVIAPPRRFAGIDDFQRMQALLVAGRKSNNGSYYVHAGDLSWWLYYIDADQELMNHAYLWESPERGGELDGWALLTPGWRSFDVFAHPALRGSWQAQAMYAWGEERITEIAAAQGKQEIYTIWISAHDPLMAAYLQGRGFERHPEYHVQMARTLSEDLPLPELPQGYAVRNVRGEVEADQRAAASYAAFQSDKPWDSYVKRYHRFMQSPVYRAEHDLVVAAPDGRLASFCILWMDEVNKVGLFEPVGTHPDFQRMGLGKALMLAGLQRMQAEGMQAAIVNTDHDNLAALGLYRSAGFEQSDELLAYFKRGLK
jgi:ribosomal protein S18 acetylase RimI-like enzyme